MKKRTNKILIIAIAVFVIVVAVRVFIGTARIKKEMKQKETGELIINHK